jgi:hypothetical protein
MERIIEETAAGVCMAALRSGGWTGALVELAGVNGQSRDRSGFARWVGCQ